MVRVAALFALLGIVCGIVAGLHYYFWIRLVRDTNLVGTARTVATSAIVGLGILVPATMLVGRAVPRLGRLLAWPGFTWLGMSFILFVILLVLDGTRLGMLLYTRLDSHGGVIDASRRTFLARVLAGGAVTVVFGVTAAAMRAALGSITVKRVDIVLDKLPAALDGTSIVQVCDLHVGGLLGRDFVERITRSVNDLNPDVVAVVGDLVDGTIEQLRPALEPMKDLRARHGIFFVTGNHEYYSRSGARAWMRECTRMGFHVLRNERVAIGSAAGSFDLAGVPDHSASRFPEEGPPEDVARAMAGRDPSRAVVLLAHQPIAIHEASRHGVDLQLSGHTHGGQIWPWGALVRLQQPYIRGLHRVGPTQLYVSCGTGFWGPPMRLGSPAEITHIVLRAKHAA